MTRPLIRPAWEPRRGGNLEPETELVRWAPSWLLVLAESGLISSLSLTWQLLYSALTRPADRVTASLVLMAFSGCEYLLFWSNWVTDFRPPSLTRNYTLLLLLDPTGPSLVPGTVQSQTGLVSRVGGRNYVPHYIQTTLRLQHRDTRT